MNVLEKFMSALCGLVLMISIMNLVILGDMKTLLKSMDAKMIRKFSDSTLVIPYTDRKMYKRGGVADVDNKTPEHLKVNPHYEGFFRTYGDGEKHPHRQALMLLLSHLASLGSAKADGIPQYYEPKIPSLKPEKKNKNLQKCP